MQRLAEFPGEPLLILTRESLTAEHDGQILVQRTANFRELDVGNILRQIDA